MSCEYCGTCSPVHRTTTGRSHCPQVRQIEYEIEVCIQYAINLIEKNMLYPQVDPTKKDGEV